MKVNKKQVSSIIIAALMVFSVVGVVVVSYRDAVANEVVFGDFKFHQSAQGWTTTVAGRDKLFYYFPGDVAQSNVSNEAFLSLKLVKSVMVTYDDHTPAPDVFGLAQYHIEQTLSPQVYVIRGLVNSTTALASISCANATAATPVVLLSLANESSTVLDGNCVLVRALGPSDLMMQVDALMFKMLGIT